LAGVTRGDIYRVRLPAGRGHEQRERFGVVVQADALLALSTVLIAPMSRSAAPATFRPEIDIDGQPTRVLVEQLLAVDLERLDTFAGCLTARELHAVDETLELVLGL
jgi:mRNA interferase MazF